MNFKLTDRSKCQIKIATLLLGEFGLYVKGLGR
jgi:hypothetical protein